MKQQKDVQSRRSALKTIGGGIAGSVLLGSSLSEIAAADIDVHPGDNYWLTWDSASYNWNAWQRHYYEIDCGLWLLGAGPGAGGGWDTEMQMYSYGAARRYPDNGSPNNGDPIGVIDGTWTGYEDDGNGSAAAVLISNDHRWIGGDPTPQFTNVEIAESALENLAVAVIDYASSTVSTLKNGWGTLQRIAADWNRHTTGNSDVNEKEEWGWWYGDGWNGDQPSDPENWFRFIVRQTCELGGIRTWGRFKDGGIWSNPMMRAGFDITTHAPISCSTMASTGSSVQVVDMMSEEEQRRWGMELVTPAQLSARGINPNRYKKTRDGKIWWSTTPKVTVEAHSKVMDDAKGDHSIKTSK